MSELSLRLGTRSSRLALAQSRLVADQIQKAHPQVSVELVPIQTRGDREPGELKRLGGKGLFTRELEQGLLDDSLQLAVHSLKDLPVERPPELVLAATPERGDPRDCLLSESGGGIDDLPRGATVLTGSDRRRGQLLARRSDLQVEPIRGNVETRIERWQGGDEAALILALAGIQRLGLEDLPLHPIPSEVIVPAPGQGVLAVETRSDSEAEHLCRAIHHPPTALAARAERCVIAAFEGDCFLPLGAWAQMEADGAIRVRAWLGARDGEHSLQTEAVDEDPDRAAGECVRGLQEQGADEVLSLLMR